MIFYCVSFLNAARFARGRDLYHFSLKALPTESYPKIMQNAAKNASSTKWGASRHIFAGLFCCILRYFGVTLGR